MSVIYFLILPHINPWHSIILNPFPLFLWPFTIIHHPQGMPTMSFTSPASAVNQSVDNAPKKQQNAEDLSFCALLVSCKYSSLSCLATLHCVDCHSKYEFNKRMYDCQPYPTPRLKNNKTRRLTQPSRFAVYREIMRNLEVFFNCLHNPLHYTG